MPPMDMRNAVDAAEAHVDLFEEAHRAAIEERRIEPVARHVAREALERVGQSGGVLMDALGLMAIGLMHAAQDVGEGGTAKARGLGKIGAAPERLALGR